MLLAELQPLHVRVALYISANMDDVEHADYWARELSLSTGVDVSLYMLSKYCRVTDRVVLRRLNRGRNKVPTRC